MKMLIASCRRRFDSPRLLGTHLRFRLYPHPRRANDYRAVTRKEIKTLAAGRSVCILVHGFNTPMRRMLDAYAELQTNMQAAGVLGPKGYGRVIGFAWPGWTATTYFPARRSANIAAGFLRELLTLLGPTASQVDIQAHSLGARVALGALLPFHDTILNNLLLTAAAVDNNILEPGQAFHGALAGCKRCWVYHSRRDAILRRYYRLGDLSDGNRPALGLRGPRRRDVTLRKCPNVHVVDASAVVAGHGDYRRSLPVFQQWGRLLRNDPMERYEIL